MEIDNIDDLNPTYAIILQQIIEAIENPELLESLLDQSQPQDGAEKSGPDNEQTADEQQLQIALAAALPALHPEARSQVEPILDQLKQGGFTALAGAITELWNGEGDAEKLLEGLNDRETAIMRLAFHLIEHPEEVEKMMSG